MASLQDSRQLYAPYSGSPTGYISSFGQLGPLANGQNLPFSQSSEYLSIPSGTPTVYNGQSSPAPVNCDECCGCATGPRGNGVDLPLKFNQRVCLACLGWSNCVVCLDQDQVGVYELCGKYQGSTPEPKSIRVTGDIGPGMNCLAPDCDGLCVNTRVLSRRIVENTVKSEAMTSDGVFCVLTVNIQQLPIESKIKDAVYFLQNPFGQIDSYVKDVIRAELPTMSLEEAFSNKDAIASAVSIRLAGKMSTFGWKILQVLVTDVEPDAGVKNALNEIQRAKDHRKAAKELADAAYSVQIFRAEGDAEAAALMGEGISRQRQSIVDGLLESIGEEEGMRAGMVQEMLLMSQYFDALEKIAESQTTTMIVKHDIMPPFEMLAQIRQGIFPPELFGKTTEDIRKSKQEVIKPRVLKLEGLDPISSSSDMAQPTIEEHTLPASEYFVPKESAAWTPPGQKNISDRSDSGTREDLVVVQPKKTAVSPAVGRERVGWWTAGASLPAGWRADKTGQGRWFFINDTTKTTQWEPPAPPIGAGHAATSSEPSPKVAPATEVLPEGWRSGKTEAGRTFYINDEKRVTQWDRPAPLQPTPRNTAKQKSKHSSETSRGLSRSSSASSTHFYPAESMASTTGEPTLALGDRDGWGTARDSAALELVTIDRSGTNIENFTSYVETYKAEPQSAAEAKAAAAAAKAIDFRLTRKLAEAGAAGSRFSGSEAAWGNDDVFDAVTQGHLDICVIRDGDSSESGTCFSIRFGGASTSVEIRRFGRGIFLVDAGPQHAVAAGLQVVTIAGINTRQFTVPEANALVNSTKGDALDLSLEPNPKLRRRFAALFPID